MPEPNFWDFVMEGGWELLFPEDEEDNGREFECPHCGYIITPEDSATADRNIEVIAGGKFKCPGCEKEIEIRN